MPKEISGKVAVVRRFTMDLALRKVVRQLSHLPIGHIFYFVVLDFDVSVVSETTRSQIEYERTLDELSERQVNVLEAVGHDVNDKLSLDLKRTGIYFADELSSLPDAEHRASRDGISNQIPLSQRPVRWCITELPSGSKAFFTEEMMQERLLEEQQDQEQLLSEQTQHEQMQPSRCRRDAPQQKLLGQKVIPELPVSVFQSPGEQRPRFTHTHRGCRQLRYLQVPPEQSCLHHPQSPQKPRQTIGEDKMELKTPSTWHA
ncbi:hypothetical protein TcWFU_001909 [Taenia crassiceps]|uniref:Uncharacterized protein n=1 Tax=Taenia crassiceps TaxID=6207 RepID=A0ABR4Q1I1_9CEST